MLRTGAMPKMNQLAGTYYVYPQMLDYIRRADVISVQIGSNDALEMCIRDRACTAPQGFRPRR